MSLADRLLSLSVDDVMSKLVISVLESQSMAAAADLLAEHEISAAPVVDATGCCVGIISATDFAVAARPAEEEEIGPVKHRLRNDEFGVHIESTPQDRVKEHMTTAIQTIARSSPLLTAARVMSAEHIHHLPVIDSSGRPNGIVSTMDIVAAVVNAVDEMRIEGEQ